MPHDDAEIERRLGNAHDCYKVWRKSHIAERQEVLSRVAGALRAGKENFSFLITSEMGKPIEEARAEIEKCAVTCDFYSANAVRLLADERVDSGARDSRVVFDPIGVVLAVMPWNYPFWQVIRATAPAIAVGNTVVMKHAANVPQCALALETLFRAALAPEGLFATLLVESGRVAPVIRDDRVAAVTFTGSTPVGRSIAQEAGAALKKHVLELGGSDPFIVLSDADIPEAARAAARSRFSNAGQSCISAKRFIVENDVADQFADAFVRETRTYQAGDPFNDATRLGPMARRNLRDELHAQVDATVKEGAVIRVGGKIPEGEGNFYPATILDHVEPEMTAATQETFGPAASIIRVRNSEHALDVANATAFGLGAAVWTGDLDKGQAIARDIEAGAVFVNAVVASDPRLPFGGIKQSGYGRELGVWGLREFANVKTMYSH
ncbi:NAD-dependent succinate-semialdehyde dehydrogenase [Paraburkholderia largidicola]|uniref:Succinate-semialdehyde dehydrogenase n=1 Tax=Paraburkholderia largidicola TaxID=3014751 RepID=A0A7I8C3E2_9BURK|nr:NAD-dependent succinate-semialdehyde dehydrogenase [Paraburkholderia sp. PGU16]BCF95049.1 succinate-semialdehyde dehydrogenase [Paraburkholderia sp. PGU16]